MATKAPPTGTVAFLFTDIEGSARRWQTHGAVMGQAVARHNDLMRAAIAARGGHVFKTVGDAFCAAFATAPAALGAALDAQRALAAEPWGEPGPIRVRMAVHVGAAEERDADYFGPAVNRVARLLAAGHGGQVLLSLPASELVHDALPEGVVLRDLGEHRLKDLTRPERIFQVVAPDLPADFPALATLDARPNNLPLQATPFIGREAQVASVRERLGQHGVRLVTLTGPGGTGKTRLALQVAAESVEGYPHGVWFIELEQATDEERVAAGIADALGVREVPGQPLAATLQEHLRAKRLLLVLDNFEQVVAAGSMIAALLRAAPDVRALVTSRIRLGLNGEHEVKVPPLGLPPPDRPLPPPERLAAFEAVRLFLERAQAAKAGFALSSDNAPAVARICRELDGLPLAIELAAARVRMLPPKALLARLTDKLGLLTGGERDRPTRQQTLRGAIAWSHDLLPAAERTLFARLSVFAGGWDVEAAEAVANPGGELDLFAALEALVDHSLVRQEETAGGEPRFSLLATIREFAREQLERAGGGEAELTRMLHAEHYLALAETADRRLSEEDQALWLDRLETEHDNLRAAFAWCDETGEAELGLRLAGALRLFWWIRGHLSEGRAWIDRFLEAGPEDAPSPIRARALDAAGQFARDQGDYAAASRFHGEALGIYEQAGDRDGMARVYSDLGSIAYFQGRYDEAAMLYEESLALCRELENPLGVGLALNQLGALAFVQGLFARAAENYEESLAVSRRLRHRPHIAGTLVNLAETYEYQGELERASGLYREALPQVRAVGDKQCTALALVGLGNVTLALGDPAQAGQLLNEGLSLANEIGDKATIVSCLYGLARFSLSQGDLERATRLLGAAESLRTAIGAALPEAYRAPLERSLTSAKNGLGEPAFAALFATGGRLTLEEAVVLASRGNGSALHP